MIPLLDGTQTRSQIAEKLSAKHTMEMVFYALSRMQKRALLSAYSPLPREHVAFYDSVGGDAQSYAEVVGQISIAVHGVGDVIVDIDRVKAALHESKLAVVETGGDFVLIVTDDYLQIENEAIVARLAAKNTPWMMFKSVGRELWLGPIVNSTSRTSRNVFDAQLFWDRLKLNRPTTGRPFKLPKVCLPSTRQHACAMAVTALQNYLSNNRKSRLTEYLITVDAATMKSTEHPLPRQQIEEELTTLDSLDAWPLQSCIKVSGQDSGYRSCSPERTVARLSKLLSPHTGIIRRLERVTNAPGYVYGASHINPYLDIVGDQVLLRETMQGIGLAHGKGSSDAQSQASCLAEAVERYSCCYQGNEPSRRATLGELGPTAVDPQLLLHYSEQQYADREQTNARADTEIDIPEPFDPEATIEWTASWSQTEGVVKWLPTAYCYLYHPQDQFFNANSNGCAAGNTREEAIIQGFLELVERDAVSVWWYNQLPKSGVDLDSFNLPFFSQTQSYHRSVGRSLHVLDLTSDMRIPVVVAVSMREDGSRIHMRMGSHFDMKIALVRALSELNQAAPFDPDYTGPVYEMCNTEAWLQSGTVAEHPYIMPTNGLRSVSVVTRKQSLDILDDIELISSICRNAGMEMLLQDLTRPEAGFPTVRVTVPGMRHWWRQLGPGRLYDVPVELGWLNKPKTQAELNPLAWIV